MQFISPGELRQRGMLGMNRRNIDYIGRYNRRDLYPLVDDKLQTKLLAEEHGIPMPRLRFVVSEQHQIREYEERLASMDSFVLKPAKDPAARASWW